MKLARPSLISYLPVFFTSALLLTGCDDKSSQTSSGTTSDEVVNQPAQPAKTDKIVFLGWSDFISPEAIEMFTKSTGIPVEHVPTESFEEVRGHLESDPTRYDVAIAEAGIITEWANLRLIQSLDHKQLPNMSNMDERYMNLDTDPGNVYSIPVLSGTTLIAYRSDKFTPKEESWGVLWDPAVRGKVALLDEPREAFAVGFLRNGHSLNSLGEVEFAAAEKNLLQLVQESNVQFGEPFGVLDKLLSGEVWVTQCYSGDGAVYVAKDAHIKLFVPTQGATLWVDNWVIPRDSQNVNAAHAFINFMMRPEAAAATSNFSHYKSPNKAAYPLLDEDLRNDPVVYPPADVLARCEILDPRNADRERRLQLGMGRLMKAGRTNKSNLSQEDSAQAPAVAISK